MKEIWKSVNFWQSYNKEIAWVSMNYRESEQSFICLQDIGYIGNNTFARCRWRMVAGLSLSHCCHLIIDASSRCPSCSCTAVLWCQWRELPRWQTDTNVRVEVWVSKWWWRYQLIIVTRTLYIDIRSFTRRLAHYASAQINKRSLYRRTCTTERW